MSEIAERFRASTGAVRTALVLEGVPIRARGRPAKVAPTTT